jgi:hypothetical protein
MSQPAGSKLLPSGSPKNAAPSLPTNSKPRPAALPRCRTVVRALLPFPLILVLLSAAAPRSLGCAVPSTLEPQGLGRTAWASSVPAFLLCHPARRATRGPTGVKAELPRPSLCRWEEAPKESPLRHRTGPRGTRPRAGRRIQERHAALTGKEKPLYPEAAPRSATWDGR